MDCGAYPDFVISPTGRRGIGVVQPESGIDYPFVDPSNDIKNLIANLVLVLDVPYDEQRYQTTRAPFYVQSVVGLGCIDAVANVQPAITIANNDGYVVFDSNVPSKLKKTAPFFSKQLDDDYVFYSWYSEWSYCKIIAYRSWAITDADKQHYNFILTPQRAVIDSRAVTVRPQSIKSISILWPAKLCEPEQRVNVFDVTDETNINLKSGYNVNLSVNKQRSLLGVTSQLTIAATSGAGLGKYNGCSGADKFDNIVYDSAELLPDEEPAPPPPPPITSINGTRTNSGDALLMLKDCLWFKKNIAVDCKRVEPEQPTDNETTEPVDPCNPPDPPAPGPELPCAEDENGARIKAIRTFDPDIYGHAKIGGDCAPCCECEDYKNTALKMNAYASQYNLIGQRAINAKDIHEQNVQKWLDVQACSLGNPLRLLLVAQRCPYMDIVMIACNPCTDACLPLKQLTLALTNDVNAVAVFQPGYTAMFSSDINGRPVAIDTTTPNQFTVNFAELRRGESSYVRFRVKMSVAAEYSITGELTGTLSDDTPILTGCSSDENQDLRVAAVAIAQQALQCDANGKTTLP